MKKSIKRILAIALTIGMIIGVGIPALAVAEPNDVTPVVAAATTQETTRDRALRFAVLLIPIIGPFIYLFMDNSGSKLPTFIVSLVAPLLGPLLFLFGIL